MDDQIKETIERAEADIEDAELSQQPRFQKDLDGETFFNTVVRWTKMAGQDAPAYERHSMKRDLWLTNFWQLEPHLAGVLNSMVGIDKNRAWSLIGGRNQVRRFTRVLHNYWAAPNLRGWRPGIAGTALSFYQTDLGGVVELGRDGESGPLAAMFHVDPTRCRLMKNVEEPLEYSPKGGSPQKWTPEDFFRVSSMPSILEDFNGLGYCFVSRCLELAQIMIAVYQHDKEQLGARAPRGLLLLQGIRQEQWNKAMESREESLDQKMRLYFGAVAVLATSGVENIDAKLVALSQLPAHFDLQVFTSLLMYGYALCAGYDPSEFYPVQFGSLGRGTEMEVQHEKATGKGQLDFVHGFQEQLQEELPDSLQYEFEERDDAGEAARVGVLQAKATLVKTMADTGATSGPGGGGSGVLTDEQIMQLWAEQGLVPEEWTAIEEDVEATDTEEIRQREYIERMLDSDRVQRAAELFPDEPIVRYTWPLNKSTILFPRAGDLYRRHTWHVHRQRVERQDEEEPEVLFEDPELEFTITDSDAERAVATAVRRVGPEVGELLDNEPLTEEELVDLAE